jgi:hypothetical protein
MAQTPREKRLAQAKRLEKLLPAKPDKSAMASLTERQLRNVIRNLGGKA